MSETPGSKAFERESIALRTVWLLVFVLIWQIGAWVLGATVVLQLLYRLISGCANVNLASFGSALSEYLAQIGRFGTFASEQKPWPFSAWPQASETHVSDAVRVDSREEEPKL